MTENDRTACHSYLNKLVGENNCTFHYSRIKNPVNANYSNLNEKI